jgi:hypothetical protein
MQQKIILCAVVYGTILIGKATARNMYSIMYPGTEVYKLEYIFSFLLSLHV